jgi:hypothetical protein
MPLSRMIRATLALAGAALIGFHGWLFAAQAAAGRLEDPWVVVRWIAAAGVLAGLIAVRRRGGSLWGRKSVAIWMLAALLHGPASASQLEIDFNSFALPETVATTVLQLVSSAALGAGLWLLAALLTRRAHTPRLRFTPAPAFAIAGSPGTRRSQRFSPRPPPLRR